MANRIAELESELTELKRQRDALTAQIAEVDRELIQARNEAARNKPLTPLMIDAVRHLDGDAVIKQSRHRHPYYAWIVKNGASQDLPARTFDGLYERQMIERSEVDENQAFIRVYRITPHGRAAIAKAVPARQ